MGLFGGIFGGSGDSKQTTSASTTTNTTQNNDNKISNDNGGSVIGSGGGALTIDNHSTVTGISAADSFGFTNGLVKAVLDQANTETSAIGDLAKAGLGTLADALGKDNANISGQGSAGLATVAGLAQGSKISQVGVSQYLPIALGGFLVVCVLYIAIKHKG